MSDNYERPTSVQFPPRFVVWTKDHLNADFYTSFDELSWLIDQGDPICGSGPVSEELNAYRNFDGTLDTDIIKEKNLEWLVELLEGTTVYWWEQHIESDYTYEISVTPFDRHKIDQLYLKHAVFKSYENAEECIKDIFNWAVPAQVGKCLFQVLGESLERIEEGGK